MAEIDIYQKIADIEEAPKFSVIFGDEADRNDRIANHRTWLQSIRKEHPQTAKPYKVESTFVTLTRLNTKTILIILMFHLLHESDWKFVHIP